MKLATPMSRSFTPDVLSPTCVSVIGCGRKYRCDDQVGLCVAGQLAALRGPSISVIASEAPGADLLTHLDSCELLVVIDAVRACPNLAAGQWKRIDLHQSPGVRVVAPPGGENVPTHFLGVNAALALGRELGLLPANVWLYVVAGCNFGFGDELSPGMATAVRRVVRRVRRDIVAWLRAKERAHA